ncbi:hypothetical protein B1R32_1303 [Abditibacterium utsteinense]|uniref:Uncharacterized protein n=1 Tax=Abditibacterium utsteinense TaxID=1960156 RepID=A0A2S8SP06_9BACT|nr:DUF6232 family protein [Abditibacterium utsteinense]PQV62516.1 hypothetical protein B1R32_1303 [Abditibacterium utsteinense]
MSDQIFLDEPGIKVTSQRIIVGTTTYSARNINSVSVKREPPDFGVAVVAAIFGTLILIIGFVAMPHSITFALVALLISLFFFGCSFVIFKNKKAIFRLVIVTSAQQIQVLESPDEEFVQRISTAIGDAIAFT